MTGIVTLLAWPIVARGGDDPQRARGGAFFDVRDFGAVGDGRADDTDSLQAAIDAAGRTGGGVVRIPPGTWFSGTLHLRSRLTLEIARGATLLASPHGGDFDDAERLPFSTGSDGETTDFAHALLAGCDLERVAIVGGGVIEMNRDSRIGPKPIALKRCRFVSVRDLTIVHAPNYAVSLGGCDDVAIDGVTIREAYADGIDPDCCRRVRISNCDVQADDDALCLKTSFLLGRQAVTEDVVVTNCRLASVSNCFKIGTESTGDVRRVLVSKCVLDGRPRDDRDLTGTAEGGGIAIQMVDGGTLDGVVVSDVVMTNVPAPIFVRVGDRGRDQESDEPGRIRNVTIADVVATRARGTASITGLASRRVEGVTLRNVRIATLGTCDDPGDLDVPERTGDYPKPGMFGELPAFGLYVRHARDIVLRDVALTLDASDARPAMIADDVASLEVDGLVCGASGGAGPAVWLHDVAGGAFRSRRAPDRVAMVVRVTGDRTRALTLAANTTGAAVDVAPESANGVTLRTTDEIAGAPKRTPPRAG